MKKCGIMFFILAYALSICSSFVSKQEKHYIEHLVLAYIEDVHRQDDLFLAKSDVHFRWDHLNTISITFLCYRSLSLDTGRALIMKLATQLIERLNSDPLLQNRDIFIKKHFCVDDLLIKIKDKSFVSWAADANTGMKRIFLNRGIINYTTFTMSPFFSTKIRKYRENYRDNLFLTARAPVPGVVLEKQLKSAVTATAHPTQTLFHPAHVDVGSPGLNQVIPLGNMQRMDREIKPPVIKTDLKAINYFTTPSHQEDVSRSHDFNTPPIPPLPYPPIEMNGENTGVPPETMSANNMTSYLTGEEIQNASLESTQDDSEKAPKESNWIERLKSFFLGKTQPQGTDH